MTSSYDTIPQYNQLGILPPGEYKPDPEQFKIHFVDNHTSSTTRKEVFEGYKKYCHRIIETNSVVNQWVDGSFTTNKTNPGDVDLFTVFDGVKLNDSELVNEVNELICGENMKSLYKCHGFGVCKYPEEMEVLHQIYKEKKAFYLDLWKTDKKMMRKFNIKVEKGVIQFDNDGLEKMRGL